MQEVFINFSWLASGLGIDAGSEYYFLVYTEGTSSEVEFVVSFSETLSIERVLRRHLSKSWGNISLKSKFVLFFTQLRCKSNAVHSIVE